MNQRRWLLTACVGLGFLMTCARSPHVAPTPLKQLAGRASAVESPFFAAWTRYRYAREPIDLQTNNTEYNQPSVERIFVRDFFAGSDDEKWVRKFAAAHPGKLYIHGDYEPNGKPDTCHDPGLYAQRYAYFFRVISSADSTARFSPSGFKRYDCDLSDNVLTWADKFYAALQAMPHRPRVDEWRFHEVTLEAPADTAGVRTWYNRVSQLAQWSVDHGAPMVLASWGFHDVANSASVPPLLEMAMDLLRNDARIKQAVWWGYEHDLYDQIHPLLNAQGSLTAIGQRYVQDPGVMSVAIDGSTGAPRREPCTWSASVTNGVAPFAYTWRANRNTIGTGPEVTYQNRGRAFTLEVTVKDRYGVTRTATKNVAVASGQTCPTK